jgi:hypothetical protein
MRIELRDGQWAELRERINHADDKDLKRAVQRGRDDPMEKWDVDTIIVRKFLRDWHVSDPDGNPIPVTDEDAIDRAPDDIIEKLALAAGQAWVGATVPNEPTPPSSDDS